MDAKTFATEMANAVDTRRTQPREPVTFRLRPALTADIDRFQELQAIRLGRPVGRGEAVEWLLSIALVLDHATGILAAGHGLDDSGAAGGLHAALREFGRTMPGTAPAQHLHKLAQTVSDHGPVAAADIAGVLDAAGHTQAQVYQASGVTDAETFANTQEAPTGPEGGSSA